MPTTRRAFLAAASLAALATVLPAQARPRAPGRGSGSLRLAFASWPGIGSVAGPKLAHGLWSATQAELRGAEAAAAQLLVARFVSGKPQAGFASPVAKIGASDRGSVLSRLLPGDAYFPGSHFFPDDHFLPGEAGLLVADRYDAAVAREAAPSLLAPARRKAATLHFARRAARRLAAQLDPTLGFGS